MTAAALIVQFPLFILMLVCVAGILYGLAHAFFEGLYVYFSLVELLKGIAYVGISTVALYGFYNQSLALAGGAA